MSTVELLMPDSRELFVLFLFVFDIFHTVVVEFNVLIFMGFAPTKRP